MNERRGELRKKEAWISWEVENSCIRRRLDELGKVREIANKLK